MPCYTRLRTFLNARSRTCTSLGISLLFHIVAIVLTDISFAQKPESGTGKGESITVNLVTALPPQPSQSQEATTEHIHPSPATSAMLPTIATKQPRPQTQSATLNISMTPTYHFKVDAAAPQETTKPSPHDSDLAKSGTPIPSNEIQIATENPSQSATTIAPDYVDNTAPNYPPMARKRGQEGTAILRVNVDKTGCPTAVTLHQSSGFTMLDEAAIQSVRQWKFKPARAGFFEVSAIVEIPIRFHLNKQSH